MIDNIADNVDRTRDRMSQQTSHISIVDRKDRTCGMEIKNCYLFHIHIVSTNLFYPKGYWMVILLLFVAIVVVASIPKHN